MKYFTKKEIGLWIGSVILIVGSFILFDRENYMTLAASVIGVTSIIMSAKGNPIGQCLMIIFSLLYGMISYSFNYYGEMITYLGMTMPMAIFLLIAAEIFSYIKIICAIFTFVNSFFAKFVLKRQNRYCILSAFLLKL